MFLCAIDRSPRSHSAARSSELTRQTEHDLPAKEAHLVHFGSLPPPPPPPPGTAHVAATAFLRHQGQAQSQTQQTILNSRLTQRIPPSQPQHDEFPVMSSRISRLASSLVGSSANNSPDFCSVQKQQASLSIRSGEDPCVIREKRLLEKGREDITNKLPTRCQSASFNQLTSGALHCHKNPPLVAPKPTADRSDIIRQRNLFRTG
ncbi:unnamed protein product [Protopolystoma xenopodis]|uniref:Uncharacterized protein n=1 Tax=Protopolystoma xenopodis TaxID=117903 RepID=A0A3S5AID9_9PLAT|nr:unnamed protein product [Protopolystoma xenopodis]